MDRGEESYRRFLNGEERELATLLRLYREGLVLFIDGYVHSVADAEDLAEEVFVKLCVKKPPYKNAASFKTWLFTIGKRLAIDHLRRQKRLGTEEADEALPDEKRDVERAYLKKERDEAVLSALQKLPPEDARVLFLTYFEGLPRKEAGKVLGKSAHAVETQLWRAKKALRDLLEQEGFEYENL